MDHNPLEKERGITILSKWTVVKYGDYTFNIVDTPGHADFGGEVERILSMVDGVCLLVDATEGVMTQTKFVLSKALQAGLKPIVVINKIDRPTARIQEVENEIFDLFVSLDATDDQLDFPTLYASAREGWCIKELNDEKKDMQPLFESILTKIPIPKVDETTSHFKFSATNLENDKHLGRLLTGRITSGTVKVGDKLKGLTRTGALIENSKVLKLLGRSGLDKTYVNEAYAGDIISIAGFPKTGVTDTICSLDCNTPVPTKELDPPIISVTIQVNDSPLAGKEGKLCGSILLRDRLIKEQESNITLTIKQTDEKNEILARGEMQIGILVETMRREGFELALSSPQVLFKKDNNGKTLEPVEELTLDVEQDDTAQLVEKITQRSGELVQFIRNKNGKARLIFKIPTRGLIGFRSEFVGITRGSGVMHHMFDSYQPHFGEIVKTRKGVMIALEEGKCTGYALQPLEARGTLFVTPMTPAYEGMIVGSCSKEQDVPCNPCKAKHLTNMRAAGSEEQVRLTPIKAMSLEEALTFIQTDELIEVTPKSIRLRKRLLTEGERKKAAKGIATK
jgi:GTP-binding protein